MLVERRKISIHHNKEDNTTSKVLQRQENTPRELPRHKLAQLLPLHFGGGWVMLSINPGHIRNKLPVLQQRGSRGSNQKGTDIAEGSHTAGWVRCTIPGGFDRVCWVRGHTYTYFFLGLLAWNLPYRPCRICTSADYQYRQIVVTLPQELCVFSRIPRISQALSSRSVHTSYKGTHYFLCPPLFAPEGEKKQRDLVNSYADSILRLAIQ